MESLGDEGSTQFAMEENGCKETAKSLKSPRRPSPSSLSSNPSDEEVDKFYALLENIRAVREVWGAGKATKKAKTEEKSKSVPVWTPTFEWEDFQAAEQSSKSDGAKDGEGAQSSSSLDLKLGL